MNEYMSNTYELMLTYQIFWMKITWFLIPGKKLKKNLNETNIPDFIYI